MFDLLESFTPVQIFTFIILFAIAFKQTVDFIDWLKEKIHMLAIKCGDVEIVH